MTLLAATLLGPNTAPALLAMVAGLRRRGHDLEVVAGGSASGLGTAAADAVAGLDLVWACGLLTAELEAVGCPIEVVAAPVFTGETEAVYRSMVIARSDRLTALIELAGPGRGVLDVDVLSGLTVAVNENGSWSGYRALIHELSEVRGVGTAAVMAAVDQNMVLTGAHVASVDAVAGGRADLAAIDHTIWDWLLANEPERVSELVVVDQTADWPAPPLSVGRGTAGREKLVADLLALPTADVPGLSGLVAASIDRYRFMTAAEGRR